jgi:hypothetical protein
MPSLEQLECRVAQKRDLALLRTGCHPSAPCRPPGSQSIAWTGERQIAAQHDAHASQTG